MIMTNFKRLTKFALAATLFAGITTQAQLQDEKNVSITMDLQPVLQLDMTTANNIEFVFDDVNEYIGGITQYGATILKINSTVSWDLYAIGRSQGNIGVTNWDQQVDYGTGTTVNAVNALPLSALELRQSRDNNGGAAGTGVQDYFSSFSHHDTPTGNNSIYVDPTGTATPPGLANKYIAGHSGTTGVAGDDFMSGGSYLNTTGTASDFYYSIDYRILPGLPATFPMAHEADSVTSEALAAGTYAEPGVYTMYVQYILLEDQ